MLKNFLKVSLLVLTLCSMESAFADESHVWTHEQWGHDRALEANEDGTPIVLYFHANWCPYCRQFKKQVLSHPQVETYLSKFPHVQIDVDKSESLFNQYNIRGFPSFFVRDKDGKMTRIRWNQEPKNFILACRKAGLK